MIGFLNIIKPTGMSSAAVVSKVKKIAKQKRVGHLGTLDPAASGVLTVAVGKATKFFDYFLDKDKVYYAIAEFGILTDTLDSEGKIIEAQTVEISQSDIKKVISKFIGEIDQVPPLYSAININGKRAYELARQGQNIEIAPRKVKIYDIKMIERIGKNKYSFRIHCSAGTYIRSLLLDLAKTLGTVANIPVIIREKSGEFDIYKAFTLQELENELENKIIKVEDYFKNLKRIGFQNKDNKSILNGMKIKNIYNVHENEEFLGYLTNHQLFGLFICENNEIKCKINLYEGE